MIENAVRISLNGEEADLLSFKAEVIKELKKVLVQGVSISTDPIIPSNLTEFSLEEIAVYWLRATSLHEPDAVVELYGRAFFDSNPAPELVAQIYQSPIDLRQFEADLNKYQDVLGALLDLNDREL